VELWGDPDPCGQNPLHDFNSTVELYRRMRPQVELVATSVLSATEEPPWTDSVTPL